MNKFRLWVCYIDTDSKTITKYRATVFCDEESEAYTTAREVFPYADYFTMRTKASR